MWRSSRAISARLLERVTSGSRITRDIGILKERALFPLRHRLHTGKCRAAAASGSHEHKRVRSSWLASLRVQWWRSCRSFGGTSNVIATSSGRNCSAGDAGDAGATGCVVQVGLCWACSRVCAGRTRLPRRPWLLSVSCYDISNSRSLSCDRGGDLVGNETLTRHMRDRSARSHSGARQPLALQQLRNDPGRDLPVGVRRVVDPLHDQLVSGGGRAELQYFRGGVSAQLSLRRG